MQKINEQWQLTTDGLSGLGTVSYYHIAAYRLTEMGNAPYSGELYDWPIQIARKINFDYDQFVEAYRAALDHFAGRYRPPVDSAILEASIKKGYELASNK